MTSPASEQPDQQPELLPGLVRASVKQAQARARATRARNAAAAPLAEVDPVARVLVDVALAHLDRSFDYAVPASMATDAVPGARVRVRFAGQDVDGFVLAREPRSDHVGSLAPLRRVVSPEPVLTPGIAALAGELASRYAGVRSDVLRLAVPPRHATTERQPSPPEPDATSWRSARAEEVWAEHEHGPAFLRHLVDAGTPRAVWDAPPGLDWPASIAQAAGAAHSSGRGVIVCVPDVKDVARVDAALTEALGSAHHVCLTSDAGPAARYRDFLALRRGAVRIAVGTRAAAFAPVERLGLVVVWDDGDDLLAEPRAPYAHTREVLLLRAEREGAAALLGGFARSVEADFLVRTGWARELGVARARLRERVTVSVAGATEHDRARDPAGAGARMPTQVRDAVREGLTRGPVLVQTPRAGYALALACDRCRAPARCERCAGPLALTAPAAPPACRWCGTATPGWTCEECGGRGLRAPVLGEARTGEELGRAFPRTRVITSAGDHVLATVGAEPVIVVATPGAEPVAAGGYATVVLLDTALLLGREDLRAAEEALRRWSNAVGLVRPGGRALAVGDPAHPALQALVRWDHAGFAQRETRERRAARLPPATRLATVTGEPGALDDVVTLLDLPAHADVLGPTPTTPTTPTSSPTSRGPGDQEHLERLVIRVPRADGAHLSRALGELQRVRSARKLDAVRIRVDPVSL